MMANFCKKCGNALNAGARFCKKCGRPVTVSAPPPAQQPPPLPQYQRPQHQQYHYPPAAYNKAAAPRVRKKRKGLIIAVAAAIVLFVFIGILGSDADYVPNSNETEAVAVIAVVDEKNDYYRDALSGRLLDYSSAQAYIASMKSRYSIILEDENGYLSGPDAAYYMTEIEDALLIYSPRFINKMVDMVAEQGSNFTIILSGEGDGVYAGYAQWEDNGVEIFLYYYPDHRNGIKANTLAHELGHAVLFQLDRAIGLEQIENDITALSGNFPYVGNNYKTTWNESTHSTVFLRDYSMFDYREDIVMYFEYLAIKPTTTAERLSNPNNETLFRKAQYISDIFSRCFPGIECPLFAPLREAERNRAG